MATQYINFIKPLEELYKHKNLVFGDQYQQLSDFVTSKHIVGEILNIKKWKMIW